MTAHHEGEFAQVEDSVDCFSPQTYVRAHCLLVAPRRHTTRFADSAARASERRSESQKPA